MHTGVMFLDCPAYMDQHGTERCGLPAAVESRYTVSSTEGPLESAKIRCPRGHWFNAPIEALTKRNTDQPRVAQHRTRSVAGPTIASATLAAQRLNPGSPRVLQYPGWVFVQKERS